MKKNILNDLKTIFKEVIEIDDIDMSSNRKSISNWDSLAHIDLISNIEEKYNIQFNLDEIIELNDIQAIVNSIESKIKSQTDVSK